MRRVLALLALAIMLAPACKEKNDTKIIVTVWSDLAVPSELDSVRIDVAGPSQVESRTFALTAGIEAGKSRLPVQLELAPLAAKNATFTAKAVGLLAQGEIVSQTAIVSFVPGQALLLNLLLARGCKGVSCPAEYTCSAGTCSQPVAVPNLPPYQPGKPLLPPDAGVGADGSVALDSSGTIDTRSSEANGVILRPADTGSTDLPADAVLDLPITPIGTGGGAGGTAGLDGPSGAGSATATGGAADGVGATGTGGTGNTGAGGTSGTGGTIAAGGTAGTSTPGGTAPSPSDQQMVAADKSSLQISYASGDSASSVTQNLTLPTSGSNGTSITWISDHSTIVSASGIVVRATSTTSVTLTATIKKGSASDAKVFTIEVILSEVSVVANDKASLQITYGSGDSSQSVKQNLTLPASGPSATTITWSSNPAGIIDVNGLVVRPTYTTAVTLTATIAKNATNSTKDFVVYVIGTGTMRGILYVGGSNLDAYRINSDGSLGAIPGSPFATGSFASAIVDPANRFLYVVGSNRVYAYGINPDGSLASLYGSPISLSGGASSITITPSGSYAYVTSGISGADAIAAYSFSSSGLPVPVSNSPSSTSPSTTPTSAVVDATGQYLYVCDSNDADTSDVQAYKINADGSLTKSGLALVTYIDNFSGSIAVSPSGIYLYASHAFSDNITAYTIGVDGSITELKGSPFPSNSSGAGSETVALAIAPSGKFLFTLQAWSAVTVCSSRINADGSLSLVGCTPSIGSDLPYGGFLAIDRTSNYLYAPNYEKNQVAIFSIDQSSGLLAPLPSTPTIAAAAPRALATTH